MTMTAQEIIDFVDDLYAGTGAGDWVAAAAMLTAATRPGGAYAVGLAIPG